MSRRFEGIDAILYDYLHTGLEGDVQFYVEEAQKSGPPVLEIGCGTGRILIPIAQAGISIVGLDNAPSMLAVAKQKISLLAAYEQPRVELFEADMRSFALHRQFQLIFMAYRTFLFLLTPSDQRKSLECIREHLADNGILIINFFDPSEEVIAACLKSQIKGLVTWKNREFIHPETGRRMIHWQLPQFDPEQQIIEDEYILEELDEDGIVISKKYLSGRLRYVHRYEMQNLLELCGYDIEALYGNFKRGTFHHGSEQIWVARKKI